MAKTKDRTELFERAPILRALVTLAVLTAAAFWVLSRFYARLRQKQES